jgi:hypothetical protein
MSQQQDNIHNIRVMGAIKIVGGLIMMPLTALVVFVGEIIKIASIFGLAAGVVAKVISIISNDKDKRAFWSERSHKFINWSSMGFVGGYTLSIPLLPGVIFMFDGIYNALTNDDSYGTLPVLKACGNLMEDLAKSINFKVNKPVHQAVAKELDKKESVKAVVAPVREKKEEPKPAKKPAEKAVVKKAPAKKPAEKAKASKPAVKAATKPKNKK